MQIQLKQKEIETALKDFITKQGINLQGRTIEIVFTNGRKENGITADLSVSDSADTFPNFVVDEEQPTNLTLVRSPVDTDQPVSPEEPVSVQVVEEASVPPKGTSLFGS